MQPTIEICVTDLASAVAAERGGADRVELCVDRPSGGLTPSLGLIAGTVARVSIPVHVLIRPRPGEFVVDEDEFDAMARDIRAALATGVAGFVLGITHTDGSVDAERTRRLVALAGALPVTFHKAIDLAPDPVVAVEILAGIGIARILTAGGPGPARDHLPSLRAMVERARGRLAIAIGGELTLHDLPGILGTTGATEVHLGSAVVGEPGPATPFGSRPGRVEEDRVRRVVERARGGSSGGVGRLQ